MPDGAYPVERGCLVRCSLLPAQICLSPVAADRWISLVADAMNAAGHPAAWRNHFTFTRGRYTVCAVMEESVTDRPVRLAGLYADMLSPVFAVRREITVHPGERAVLCSLDQNDPPFTLIGTQARVHDIKKLDGGCRLAVTAPRRVRAHIRLTCPPGLPSVTARTLSGQTMPVSFEWDALSGTGLVTFESAGERTEIVLKYP